MEEIYRVIDNFIKFTQVLRDIDEANFLTESQKNILCSEKNITLGLKMLIAANEDNLAFKNIEKESKNDNIYLMLVKINGIFKIIKSIQSDVFTELTEPKIAGIELSLLEIYRLSQAVFSEEEVATLNKKLMLFFICIFACKKYFQCVALKPVH